MSRTFPLPVGLILSVALSCVQGTTPEEDKASRCVAQAVARERSLHPVSSSGDGPIPTGCEVVMSPGMKITVTALKDWSSQVRSWQSIIPEIIITAGNGLKRSYTWKGATRSVEMWPRKERWYGSLGLYYPGDGYHWKAHRGIARGVLEEGQQHFKTIQEALKWIESRKQQGLPLVYRNDGLLVGWYMVPERKQLDVQVWQLYIAGAKPTTLPGSQDEKIIVQEAEGVVAPIVNPGGAPYR